MSNNGNGLEALAQNMDAILTAEIGAFIHNLGKLSHAFLAYQRVNACKDDNRTPDLRDQICEQFNYEAIVGIIADYLTNPGTVLTPQDRKRLESSASDWLDATTNALLPEYVRQLLQQQRLCLPHPLDDRSYAIGDFIEFQDAKWYKPQATGKRISLIFPSGSRATELLEVAHDAASGAEKEGAPKRLGGQFSIPTYQATCFGREAAIGESQIEVGRQAVIDALPGAIQERTPSKLYQVAKSQLAKGLGDTRRPINDVTLWDLSASVAAFYKAAMARLLLDGQWVPRSNFDWRLLRISFNGLTLLGQAPAIGDLLGRLEAMQNALDKVKGLLEVTYPLGNEVYRDENGSAFVVPALEGDDDHGTKLLGLVRGLIDDAFRQSQLVGEVRPTLSVSSPSAQATKLHELLQRPLQPTSAFGDALSEWWQGEPAQICTVCGLRPQGWGAPSDRYRRKASNRNVCYVCLKRRGQRASDWADEQRGYWKRTIWVDEVAGRNGRVALLVGGFDLSCWLDGTMVQTMLVRTAPDWAPKNPSFARLRRIWQTTQRFWQAVQNEDIPAVVQADRRRLVITPTISPELDLGDYHVYDAELGDVRTAVVWDLQRQALITADDLRRIAALLGASTPVATNPSEAADYVGDYLNHEADVIELYEPGGYRQERVRAGTVRIAPGSARVSDVPYTPAIPLLTEPSTFMALVPADKALDVIAKIEARFTAETGKVRNRLPLFVGAVFFDRRQPLFAALDAGRRMLQQTGERETWTLTSRNKKPLPGALQSDPHFAEYVTIHLQGHGQDTVWYVPIRMGDGMTPDDWYPYYHVVQDRSGVVPVGRRQFERDGQHWVHVEDLQPGDRITVTPARFAYLHLDTAARRFEAGQSRPWLLEQVGQMAGLWQELKGLAAAGELTETKLHAVEALFRAKRDAWRLDDRPDEHAAEAEKASYQQRWQAFRTLTEATLNGEGLGGVIQTDQVSSGLLAATMELHARIIKDRLAPESRREEQPLGVEP